MILFLCSKGSSALAKKNKIAEQERRTTKDNNPMSLRFNMKAIIMPIKKNKTINNALIKRIISILV